MVGVCIVLSLRTDTIVVDSFGSRFLQRKDRANKGFKLPKALLEMLSNHAYRENGGHVSFLFNERCIIYGLRLLVSWVA